MRSNASLTLAIAIACASLMAVKSLPTDLDTVVPETTNVQTVSKACIPADLAKGKEHEVKCKEINYYIVIPEGCSADSKCGIIMDIHGWGMTAALEEAADHITKFSTDYITIRPSEVTGQRDWSRKEWDDVHDISDFLREAAQAFDAVLDRKRIHVAGFSQGGYITFNLLCLASDLICSAAPLGIPASGKYVGGYMAGYTLDASSRGHQNCFEDGQSGPKHKRSIMYHQGKHDCFFGPSTFDETVTTIKGLYGMQDTEGEALTKGEGVEWKRYSEEGVTFEAALYDYKTALVYHGMKIAGHCFPSTRGPGQPQGWGTCKGGYSWGAEVLKFFKANPCSAPVKKA